MDTSCSLFMDNILNETLSILAPVFNNSSISSPSNPDHLSSLSPGFNSSMGLWNYRDRWRVSSGAWKKNRHPSKASFPLAIILLACVLSSFPNLYYPIANIIQFSSVSVCISFVSLGNQVCESRELVLYFLNFPFLAGTILTLFCL